MDEVKPIRIVGCVVRFDSEFRDPNRIVGAVRMIRGVKNVTAVMSITETDAPFLDPPKSPTTYEEIKRVVANYYKIPLAKLDERDRTKTPARARLIAMYLIRHQCGASYPEIGRCFGRDHTTVMYALRKVQTNREENPRFNAEVESIEKRVMERF